MNGYIAKEEIALLMPNTLSHYFKDDADHAPRPETTRPSLLARIGSALTWFAELPRRRAVLDELSSLTDHELADIGLTRSELSMVFEPSFAARRSSDNPATAGRTVSA
jgi:uncharacterized protein YjiS (DUF1127 family)